MDANARKEAQRLPERFQSYIRSLSRVREQEVILPEQMSMRSRQTLLDRFGDSVQTIATGFCHGSLGLLAQHTRFIGGFAVLLTIQQGVALSIRQGENKDSVIVFEGYGKQWTVTETDTTTFSDQGIVPDTWVPVLARGLKWLGLDTGYEIAVVCTIQPACTEPILAAISVALYRAAQDLKKMESDEADFLNHFQNLISNYYGSKFYKAYLVGAYHGIPNSFVTVDAVRGEYVVLDAPERQDMAWGLIDLGTGPPMTGSQYDKIQSRVNEALDLLKGAGYAQLNSIADIEHEELEKVLGSLPRRSRSVVRHLAQDNRRVQNMINAIRREDWQMVGAVLLMSHTSLKMDWGGTNTQIDAVVNMVEEMAFDGVYGACLTGRSGCVLIGGLPEAITECVNKIRLHFEASGEYVPVVQQL